MDLTKLVVKAIMLLENAGAQVLGLTTDGTRTNRTMWNNLGISGKIRNINNSFLTHLMKLEKILFLVTHFISVRRFVHAHKLLAIITALDSMVA